MQTLAVGTMFTQDFVRPYAFRGELPEHRQVLFSRIFMAVFLAAAFVASQLTERSIFNLGVWSLSGYAGLFPAWPWDAPVSQTGGPIKLDHYLICSRWSSAPPSAAPRPR